MRYRDGVAVIEHFSHKSIVQSHRWPSRYTGVHRWFWIAVKAGSKSKQKAREENKSPSGKLSHIIQRSAVQRWNETGDRFLIPLCGAYEWGNHINYVTTGACRLFLHHHQQHIMWLLISVDVRSCALRTAWILWRQKNPYIWQCKGFFPTLRRYCRGCCIFDLYLIRPLQTPW